MGAKTDSVEPIPRSTVITLVTWDRLRSQSRTKLAPEYPLLVRRGNEMGGIGKRIKDYTRNQTIVQWICVGGVKLSTTTTHMSLILISCPWSDATDPGNTDHPPSHDPHRVYHPDDRSRVVITQPQSPSPTSFLAPLVHPNNSRSHEDIATHVPQVLKLEWAKWSMAIESIMYQEQKDNPPS